MNRETQTQYANQEHELVDLAQRGEISVQRLDEEADWIAQKGAIEAHNLRREERREKLRAFGRSILGRR